MLQCYSGIGSSIVWKDMLSKHCLYIVQISMKVLRSKISLHASTYVYYKSMV